MSVLSVAPDQAPAAQPQANGNAKPEPYRAATPLLDLQRAFLARRLGMFVHYNMATYQDREWGDPRGPVEAFDPSDLDTDQWAAAALSAKMQYACLTTKHHDGFCIWPTKTPVASISGTARKTDVVRAYVDSFRKAGISVGLYYSILDLRNDIRHLNVTPEKIDLIKSQLTELLTDYGKIDLLIFDGWDAPWSRFSYEEIRFDEIYRLVKKLQPDCLVCELNAGAYPAGGLYYSDLKSFEQNAGQQIPAGSAVPALSCVTLTDGWFWKQSDATAELKSAKQVVDEWLLPQNAIHCNPIVNAAPDRSGRFAPNIVARLKEIGDRFDPAKHPLPEPVAESLVITSTDLAVGKPVHASNSGDTSGPDLAVTGRFGPSWYVPQGDTTGWVQTTLGTNPVHFNTLAFYEPLGKFNDYRRTRVKAYRFEASDDEKTWHPLATGTGGRAVNLHRIPRTAARYVRLTIDAAADTPHVGQLGVYDEPDRVA